jgi:putative inorganic carbon (HCO3(-)) transporter
MTLDRRLPRAFGWFGCALLGLSVGLVFAHMAVIAVLLLVAAAGAYVMFARADLILLVMVAAFPWENKLHYPSATLSIVKAIGVALMIAYLLQLGTRYRPMVYLPVQVAIVGGLALWLTVTLIVSADPATGLQQLLRWMLFITFFFLVVQLVDSREAIDRVLKCVTVSVTAAAIYGLWLFLAKNVHRAAGPLEDPNDFAYLLASTLPMVGYLIATDRRWRAWWCLCFGLIVAATLATLSRGALVGMLAVVIWGTVTRRIPFRAALVSMVMALVVAALTFTLWKPIVQDALHQKSHVAQSNVEGRETRWVAALELTQRSPVFGVGPGLYPRDAVPLRRINPLTWATVYPDVAHSTYLETLSESGIPALALFVAYLVTVWLALREVVRTAPPDEGKNMRLLAIALQGSLIIAIVSGAFLSEEFTVPFWLIGGLAVVLLRDCRARYVSARPDRLSGSAELEVGLR